MKTKGMQAQDVWEAMRASGSPFALIDPRTHRFVAANGQYAELFRLQESEMVGLSVTSLYPPKMKNSIESMHGSYARGTLRSTRGQLSLRRSNGVTIELNGWSRRIEGIAEHPLVVACAVDSTTGALVPDDGHWVDQAPHVFGLADDWRTSSQIGESRVEVLEQHLWRIALEIRTAGVLPPAGEELPLDSIKKFGELSARQREIVTRLASGQRVQEMADCMYLSPSTVRNHLTAAYRKFGVHSQIELIAILKTRAMS
jgi:DNA-binding CsgD family transcriptional regulator